MEDRTYPIHRANKVGKGRGMGQSNIWYADSKIAKSEIVPEVFKYIENYNGERHNKLYIDRDVKKRISEINFLDDYEKLYSVGLKFYDQKEHYYALIYFKAALRLNETLDVLFKLGESLFFETRYGEAIDIFNKIIKYEGETMDVLIYLMNCYDLNRDIEKTKEYANKIISFHSTLKNDMLNKILTYEVLSDIYIYEKKFNKAEETIKRFEIFLENPGDYSKDEISNIINPLKNFLNERINSLVREN